MKKVCIINSHKYLKIRLFIAVVAVVAVVTGNGYTLSAQEYVVEKNDSRDVIILPFYNYTGSDELYLSEYIPELLKKYCSFESDYSIQDASDIKQDLKNSGLSPAELYDVKTAINYLSGHKADYGITGRYIIQGGIILINILAIDVREGRAIRGLDFEGRVDDNLLRSLNKYAQIRAAWFKEYVLGDGIMKGGNLVERFTSWVDGSPLGIVLDNRWVVAALILIIFYLLSLVVVFILDHVIKRIVQKSQVQIDNLIFTIMRKPLKWIIVILGARFSVVTLGLGSSTAQIIDNIFISIIILICTYILLFTMDVVIRSWGKKVATRIDSRIDDDLVPLFVNISRVVIIILGLLMALSRFDIDIAPLIASLGIAGFAIGFAVKDSLSNIIAGVILILDHSLAVGDKVMIDADMGIIKEVGLRNTKLMTFDNEIIVIPNSELMNKRFKNYVLPDPKIRVVVNFGVAYGSDVDYVEKVVLHAIHELGDICDDPEPVVLFTSMADFALAMEAKFWVNNYIDQYGKKIEATRAIYNALNRAGINIPFPTHTVYIEKKEG